MLSITKSILLVSLITLIWAHTDPYHTCIHDQLDFEPQFIDVPIAQPPEDGRSLQDGYQNIRILFDYTGGGFNNTPTDFQNYIKNVILPPVKNIFEASLKVMPVVGNLTGQKLSTMCSGSITVPAIYNSVGVPADLVLFVDVVNDLSQTYAAFAGPCVMSTTNRRPLFGRIVYNMARIAANTNSATIDKDLSITLHESTHALGFTNGLYTYYINPTTNQALTGHYFTKVVNGESVQVLNVEPLTSRLRTYFNCPSLEGAYLENEGSSGSKNSHFERRIFYNEYMTASTIADARMTEFTLALLEGTGWYKADYSRAEPMTWGKGKGCSFLNSPCVDKTTQVSTNAEFCSPLKTMMCSWTGRGAGPCGASTLRTNAALTSSYNWWGNNTVVNDAFSDNCPIGDIYSNLDCEDERNSATATLPGQEFYGYGGKCFIATLYPPGRVAAPYGYCFKQTCELQADGNYIVKVAVGSNVVTCTNTDQITVPGLGGLLYCPDPNVFCGRQNAEGYCRKGCAARGTCVNKQCQCNDGWGGYDCTRQIYADKCAKCAGQDPFRTTCFGDSCVCNPSDNTCMCQLGLKTGSDCTGVGTPASTPTQTPTTTNTTTTNTTTAPAQNTTTSSNTTTTTTPTTTNTTSTSNNTTTATNTTTNAPTQNTTTNTTSTSNSTTTPKTNTTTTTNTTNTTTTTPTQNTTTTTTPTTTTNTTTTSNSTTTPRTNTTTTTNTTNTTTTTPTQNTTTTTPTTSTNITSTSSNTTTTPTTTNTTNTTTTTTPTTSTNTTTSTPTQNTTTTTPSTTINTTTTITNATDPKTNTTVITNTTITTNSTTTPTTSGNTTTITTTNRTTTTTTNSTATTTKTTVTTTTKTITTTNNTSTNSTNAVPSNTAVGTKQEGEANVGERDGGNTDNENNVKEPSSGINLGLIIGAAVGGIIFVSVGLYFGIRFAKNWKKNRATRAPSIKKSNSIANPALRRQMTNNQTKYAYVP